MAPARSQALLRRHRAAAGLVLALALVPLTGQCLTWDYVPEGSLGARYETNPRYVSELGTEDDAWAGVLSGSVNIRGEGDRVRIGFRPQVRFAVYTGAEKSDQLDTDDFYLPLVIVSSGQRSRYGLNTGYSDVSTRDSEIRVVDPNDPGQPGSSGRIIVVDETQQRWYVQPSAAFQVSERDRLDINLNYENVTYSEALLTTHSDFEYAVIGASWTRTLTPRSEVNAGFSIDGFRAEQPGSPIENETLTYSGNVGYKYAFWEQTTVGATLGTSRSDITLKGLLVVDHDGNPNTPPVPCLDPVQNTLVLCELKADDENFVGEVFFRQRTTDTITTEFLVSRAIQPNSDGAQVTQDIVRGFVKKAFTPRLDVSLGLTWISQQAVGDQGGVRAQRFDRDYQQAELSTSWRWTRTLSVGASYRFTSDDQSGFSSITTDNQIVTLQLIYTGLGSH